MKVAEVAFATMLVVMFLAQGVLAQDPTPTPEIKDIANDINDTGAFIFPLLAQIAGVIGGLVLIVNLIRPFLHFFEERESLQ
jgi:hypothetical protein